MAARLVFLHGLESGPMGSKFQLLQRLGLGAVEAPDCQGLTSVAARLAAIEASLGDGRDLLLVGSSFGGLMALHYANAHPQRVAGLVLCAPAVHRPELLATPEGTAVVPPPATPVRVLHGRQDAVVPLTAVEDYCHRHRLALTVVDDGHRLGASHAELAELVREVWRTSAA